jgi:stage II sporulation protein D
MSAGRLKVAPLGLNTTITVLSVERSYGNPYYSGTLEMAAEDGGLVIVNELPLEEYLYACRIRCGGT